jgi:hypothetical protein
MTHPMDRPPKLSPPPEGPVMPNLRIDGRRLTRLALALLVSASLLTACLESPVAQRFPDPPEELDGDKEKEGDDPKDG